MGKIITISREFGSGGRTIGRKVAEKLGIPCYDHELIEKIASESGLDAGYIKEHGESSGQFSWLTNAFNAGKSAQDYMWVIQCEVIAKLAKEGPCVIVGRCADYILQDKVDLLKVFIHADINVRAKRVVEVYGETDVKPLQRVKTKDKQRMSYYHFYTDRQWGDAHNYDISLDSGTVGVDKCVDIICELYDRSGE